MPADPLLALEVRTMNEVINERHKPNKPLSAILFGQGTREKVLRTETVQVDTLVGDYEMAPFVSKDGAPVAINRKNFNSYTLETPCIKLKMPLTDSDELLERRAGVINLDASGNDYIRESMLEQIDEDIDGMQEAIALRQEWMISQLLQGSISYTNAETGAAFSLTLPKPAGNTWTVSTLWTQETATPLQDIAESKRVAQVVNHGPAPTIALCGDNAAAAIRNQLEQGWITAIKTDSGVLAGGGDLRAEWTELGNCFLGRIGEVDFWHVSAEYTDDQGNTTKAIREDYVEFIPNGARGKADRTTYYGRKRSARAVLAGLAIGKIFAEARVDEDADVYVSHLQSRPLPYWKHPQWYVSMKVV